ncbi:MAG TPA: iron ABC transporter permease [Verrucomicrobiae bacterium]|jgi:iron complex transport system permease protein|nr:iron ABC transporter permease [Verrucomicrobiae bacterium]
MRPLTVRRLLWTCGGLAVLLLACVVLALKLGAVPVSVTDLVLDLGRIGIGRTNELPTEYRLIVFDLRLPRIILGVLVGAALSVAGASYQALLRNPLADPYVLGVSSGAAVGSILSLIFARGIALATPLGAFVGAGATIAGVYYLGRREGQLDTTTLLLGGVVCMSFFSAMVMFLTTTLVGRDLRGVTFWLMGDLSTPVSAPMQWIFTVGLLAGVGAIYSTSADLNLLLTGEREAVHLGVDVTRVKLVVYVSASLLTALAVSTSGAIGYVGLLVPHIVRLIFGSDYRLLIPASALCGAIAVVLADTLARTIAPPTELPVGAMTAMAGAPVFIYLLRRGLR